MTAAAVEVSPAAIEALDFDLTCQVLQWYVILDVQAKPECGKPADYIALVHDFRDCTARDKYLCADCLPSFAFACPRCKGPRLTNLKPIRG